MTNIKKVLICIWILIAVITVLTWLTPLEFTNKFLSYSFGAITISGFPLISWILTSDTTRRKYRIISFILIPATLLIIYFVDLFTFGGGYKTQDILYRNKNYKNIRIEFQMEDIGAFGYNKRTVKVIPITPLLEWVTYWDLEQVDANEWTEVNEYINELELKGG